MQGTVQWVKARTVNRDASRGQLLIEVLIALAILGLISVAFIGAMYTSLDAARVTDERSVALTLAKSQIEYVKAQSFSTTPWEYTVATQSAGGATAEIDEEPSWWAPDDPINPLPPPLPVEYEGYSVTVSSVEDDVSEDGTLRRIIAVVYHGSDNNEVFRLENYEIPR